MSILSPPIASDNQKITDTPDLDGQRGYSPLPDERSAVANDDQEPERWDGLS